MEEDKLARSFREKLRGHECDVPEELWTKIAAELPSGGFRVRRRRYYAAAAVLAMAVALGCVLMVLRHESKPVAGEQPALAVSAPAVESRQPAPFAAAAVPDTARDEVLPLPQQPVASTVERPDAVVAEVAGETAQPATDEQPAPTPMLAEMDKPLVIDAPDVDVDDAALFDDRAFAAVLQSAGKSVQPRNWLSVRAYATPSDVAPVPYVTRAAAAEMVYHHKMPLSVAATFEKRFGRWGVGTGVTYTYMHSDYEMEGNLRKGSQSLHYLGVPLYVSFYIAKVKRFSFYASAGGEVDFNIAGCMKESSESSVYATASTRGVRDKKPQFSVQARVGAAFELMSYVDLYVEPTLGYYFHHDTPVHSVWNDRPWNVGLSLGLRTGF